MLKREDVQKMAYQSYLGIDYTDKKKDELLKKYNRKIIRNYIICMMIGLSVSAGILLLDKSGVFETLTKQKVENIRD